MKSDLRDEIRHRIHDDVISHLASPDTPGTDLDDFVAQSAAQHFPLENKDEISPILQAVLHDVSGYGFLEEFFTDNTVNEIMINSSSSVFIDRAGSMEKIDIDISDQEIVRIVQKIVGEVGARFDAAHPIVDAWLHNGSRVHAVMPPISPDGPCVTIRRFVTRTLELSQFCRDKAQEQILLDAIERKENIVVAGGTSTGKTTLLNCCVSAVDTNQRIISIEETAELSTDHPHWVRLVARHANNEDKGEISLGELVKASLRMRPDRIVVGEVRSREAFDLIQALNTGHDGSLCTIHANGPDEVFDRLASLAMFAHPGLEYQALITQISFGVHMIVCVKRDAHGKRYIDSISRVVRNKSGYKIHNIDSGESQ